MMRMSELPAAIRAAINDWRLWATLSLTAAIIVNEAVIGIREGQPIAAALTRLSLHQVLLLLLVNSIIAQAGIGALPVIRGVLMTLYDWALQRRRNWKEEGVKEGVKAGGERALRTYIAAILADETLTLEDKTRFIAILNNASPDRGA